MRRGWRLPSGSWRVVGASAGLGAALLALVLVDHGATRGELLSLLRDHAGSLRQTVAAAARSNRVAGRQAETQLSARLLDAARLLDQLDRRTTLTQATLEDAARRLDLFRVTVFSPEGRPELSWGGRGRPGGGRGMGMGGPGGGDAGVLPLLLSGAQSEAVSDVHRPRFGAGGARLAAGVRRARGGAIVLSADASAVADLLRQTSLDALLDDIARGSPDLGYVVFEQEGVRLAHGDAPDAPALPATPPNPPAPPEREVRVSGRPIIEFAGAITVTDQETAFLQLGMRADGIRRAERRMLLRLTLTLLVTLALAGFGVGTVWLRHKYALLSQRHARAEEALRRRDRLVAMGELASTVAHEVRNPLNAIAMSAQRLEREFPGLVPEASRPELGELLTVVSGESQRIDRIVRQFLDYARPPGLNPRPLDVDALAAEVANAARPMAEARGVELRHEPAAAGQAKLDSDRLREALGNLVRNAIEATPAGGRVTIAARGDRQAVALEVADSGPGIPPELLPRIFDLYFTTKPEGTGVGLAVAHQIVSAHDGTLEVDSRPGIGTTMTVRLPRAAPEAAPA